MKKGQKMKAVNRGRTEDGGPNPVDVYVGKRIRLRRNILGYSQQQLAMRLGVTFQQIQKYERGFNRVGASRLWDISRVMRVPMDFFFENMDKQTEEQSPMMSANLTEEEKQDLLKTDSKEINLMQSDESLKLVKAYYKIKNRGLAKELLTLMLQMSAAGNE